MILINVDNKKLKDLQYCGNPQLVAAEIGASVKCIYESMRKEYSNADALSFVTTLIIGLEHTFRKEFDLLENLVKEVEQEEEPNKELSDEFRRAFFGGDEDD